MAKIPTYQAEVNPGGAIGGRNATGDDFGANVGDSVRDVGRSMEGAAGIIYQKHAEDDVTNVRVAMAKARAEWDVRFRDESAKSTPGDPNFAGKFTQDFRDYLGQQEEMAQTREGQHTFKLLAGELTGHFAEKAGNFAVQSAGVKAKLDWDVSQRSYATSIVTDPTSYGSVLNQAIAELRDPNGQYGRLDNNTRLALETKARDTMAQAYINGLVDNGAPELARKLLMDGRLDDQLEPKDKQRLVHAADAGITAKRVGEEHADAMARKAEKDRVAQINDDLMGKFVKGSLTMDDVRASGIPAFGDGSQHTWVTMLKQQVKDFREQPARTEPSVYADVLERVRLPYGDPRKLLDSNDIYKLYGKGLSATDTDRLAKKLTDDKSDEGQKLGQGIENFIRGVKPQLDKSTMNSLDAGGPERVYQFRTFVEQKVDAARKANEDPRELLNPESPKYLGKSVAAFQSGPQHTQAALAGRIDKSLGAANARREGETPAQYLDRVKK